MLEKDEFDKAANDESKSVYIRVTAENLDWKSVK